jgi:branched-chain amino acid transport system permease protein
VELLATIAQHLIDGVLLGGLYALLAAGLALIFGVMRMANFAQGGFVMLGMYGTVILYRTFGLDPYLLSIPIGIAALIVGYLIARLIIERVPMGDQDAQMLLTIGLSYVLINAAMMRFGVTPQSIVLPYTHDLWDFGPLYARKALVFACAASLVMMAGLWVFLHRTWLGRALRATADDFGAAELFGMQVRRLQGVAFGLGVAFAAMAGAMLTTFKPVSPTAGQPYILVMFIAVVLGGIGSIEGAVIGAFSVGVIEQLSGLVLPLALEDVPVFCLFVLTLFLRPRGLFGKRARV